MNRAGDALAGKPFAQPCAAVSHRRIEVDARFSAPWEGLEINAGIELVFQLRIGRGQQGGLGQGGAWQGCESRKARKATRENPPEPEWPHLGHICSLEIAISEDNLNATDVKAEVTSAFVEQGMDSIADFDWSTGTEDEHLEIARKSSPAELRELARSYDWNMHPERVMGFVMAQRCIDLGSALTAFLNGGPERFNYLSKRHVTDEYQGVARLLDNICLRVNSGFYLVDPGRDVAQRKRLAKWMNYQRDDHAKARKGRYFLDEEVVNTLLDDTLRLDRSQETAVYDPPSSLLSDILSPLTGLGVSRRILRYKNGR